MCACNVMYVCNMQFMCVMHVCMYCICEMHVMYVCAYICMNVFHRVFYSASGAPSGSPLEAPERALGRRLDVDGAQARSCGRMYSAVFTRCASYVPAKWAFVFRNDAQNAAASRFFGKYSWDPGEIKCVPLGEGKGGSDRGLVIEASLAEVRHI